MIDEEDAGIKTWETKDIDIDNTKI